MEVLFSNCPLVFSSHKDLIVLKNGNNKSKTLFLLRVEEEYNIPNTWMKLNKSMFLILAFPFGTIADASVLEELDQSVLQEFFGLVSTPSKLGHNLVRVKGGSEDIYHSTGHDLRAEERMGELAGSEQLVLLTLSGAEDRSQRHQILCEA